ncbi:MAG: tetratricopeptide repeat protein [Betaproteobacteria bacterium]|nr:tetratricopeptide repeat protein [Betaproteobacteria bacterium]
MSLLALSSIGAGAQMPLSSTLTVNRIPGVRTPEPQPLQEIARLLKQGQSAQALERAERLIASEPDNARARFLKSVILSDLGRTPEAAATLEKLILEFPELPEPYNNLAVIQVQRGDLEKARALLESALRANPRYALARENLGDVYLRLASDAYGRVPESEANAASARRKVQSVREILAPPAH